MKHYPEITLEVSLSDRRSDLIEEGIDAAIRIGTLADSGLVARKLLDYRIVTAASPDYWAAHGVPESPDDLAQHNCLTYSYAQQGRRWRFQTRDGRRRDIDVSGTLQANNGDLLVRGAVAGIGVVSVPSFLCADEINEGALTLALEAFEQDPIGVYVVFPHARHMTTKLRVFIDFLVEMLVRPKATLV